MSWSLRSDRGGSPTMTWSQSWRSAVIRRSPVVNDVSSDRSLIQVNASRREVDAQDVHGNVKCLRMGPMV